MGVVTSGARRQPVGLLDQIRGAHPAAWSGQADRGAMRGPGAAFHFGQRQASTARVGRAEVVVTGKSPDALACVRARWVGAAAAEVRRAEVEL